MDLSSVVKNSTYRTPLSSLGNIIIYGIPRKSIDGILYITHYFYI